MKSRGMRAISNSIGKPKLNDILPAEWLDVPVAALHIKSTAEWFNQQKLTATQMIRFAMIKWYAIWSTQMKSQPQCR